MANEVEPLVLAIDMIQAYCMEDEIQRIRRKLLRMKVPVGELLYRGFDGNRLDVVINTGSDVPERDYLFCVEPKVFYATGELLGRVDHPLTYVEDYRRPAISMYRMDKMKEYIPYQYYFKSGVSPREALFGVLKLSYLLSDKNW